MKMEMYDGKHVEEKGIELALRRSGDEDEVQLVSKTKSGAVKYYLLSITSKGVVFHTGLNCTDVADAIRTTPTGKLATV